MQDREFNLTCISGRSILKIQIKITKHESKSEEREEKEKKCLANNCA